MSHETYSRVRGPGTMDRAGFTIIELVVVMIMVGLMSLIVMPNLNLGRYRVDAVMNQINGAIRLAQRDAMVRQHDMVLAFNINNRTIRIHRDENNDGKRQDGEYVSVYQLDDGVFFGRDSAPARAQGGDPVSFTQKQEAMPAVTFHRNGSASEEGVIYLNSAGALTDIRALTIQRGTGRVTCARYDASNWVESC